MKYSRFVYSNVLFFPLKIILSLVSLCGNCIVILLSSVSKAILSIDNVKIKQSIFIHFLILPAKLKVPMAPMVPGPGAYAEKEVSQHAQYI
jgi:hypothetical protein